MKLNIYMKIFCIILSLFLTQSCSGVTISKNKKDIKAPYNGTRFDNIEPFPDKRFLNILKWRFTRKNANWSVVKNQKFYKPNITRSKNLKMTMIGHSTVLIQVNNINILTDPHYSERCSPVSWAGPKRVIKPSIKFEDLPPIDAVLISHNHYDHLDLVTLKRLNDKFSPKILVGLGNKELIESEGIENVYELDWWDKFNLKDISIHFTPVQHWSARGVFDKRKTLWGGFFIDAKKKIFFAGDTGYGKVFKMINKRFGNMDVGLIPIGGYEPRSIMKNAHINPEEAVKIFLDLKLSKAMGIHFATFEGLTDEPKEKPKTDLAKARLKYGLGDSDFIAPKFGVMYKYE
jgi:L-ascorbate metabolism protein UlaG (beta-lactamase superfamily)